ncbi:hypothetical protein J5N97_016802 [Dioscorea zingiberensis]|uniref:DYW domain-containing protein n=1 Tax=Dioscorea zingiberensis TaxID=325984 RepID=A0A9D5HG03_9LILI|nr:hypothetical protein J5N97_016802 [Dioscorea zingiberensis]
MELHLSAPSRFFPVFSVPGLSFNLSKPRSLCIGSCSCFSRGQSLIPKPQLNPKTITPVPDPREEEVEEEDGDEGFQEAAASQGICGQIEKLVFFKRYKEALELFEILQLRGGRGGVGASTYDSLVTACIGLSYSGFLDEGIEIFESMSRDSKMKPRAMHYACMIELLGREGLLDEALELIRDAPFSPTTNMWAALLTACRIHKNLELGKFAAEKLFGMEPEKLSNYIVLLNIYNSCGRAADGAKVLEALKKKGLRLLPACTWIEVKKQPHRFIFGDKSHPESIKIYERLDNLIKEMVKQGYAPMEKHLLPDVGQHEQRMLNYHSEKLAVAYGLISTQDYTPLHLVQGHRICSDCHSAIKLITVITKREIVVRDASRFHHFKHGSCSCGDYW